MLMKGVVAAVITPFDAGGEVSYPALRWLCDFLIEKHVDALFILGSTGLGPMLDMDERKRVAEMVVEHVAGRCPVMVHAGAPSTKGTVELARHSGEVGADAVSICPPYYYQHAPDAQAAHFRSVAMELPSVPVFLYIRNPRFGELLSPRLVAQLVSECENIVGVKDSSGSHLTIPNYRDEILPRQLTFLQGVESLALNSLLEGANGMVSGLATALPEVVQAVVSAHAAGQLTQAAEKQKLLGRVNRIVCGTKPYGRLLKVLEWSGCPATHTLPPFQQISDSDAEAMRRDLARAGLKL